MVQSDRQLQGPRLGRHAVLPPADRRRCHPGRQLRQRRIVDGGPRRRRRDAGEDPGTRVDLAVEDRPGALQAEIQFVEGPREESEAEAIRQSAKTFYASHNWQPFFLEGTKSLAYELWEDLGFRAPDNVVIPVGAGSSLLGCAFGFRELMKAGQIAKLPRLFVTQPLNCSPIDASFKADVDTPVSREVRKTIAEGTAIKHPMRLREIIGALRESGGGTVALTEEEIVVALRRLARQGLFTEPTSASAAAALDKLSDAGSIKSNETTVVLITGNGLKAASTVADLVQSEATR